MNIEGRVLNITTILVIIFFLSSFIIVNVAQDEKIESRILNDHDYVDTYFHTYLGENIFTNPSKNLTSETAWRISSNIPDGLRLFENKWEINGDRIDSYSNHSCAISSSSDILCWNLNNDGSIESKIIDIKNDLGVVEYLTVGASHSCAIHKNKTDNEVLCWDSNWYGQFGPGNNDVNFSSIKISENWNGISAGTTHTCGYTDNNKIYCWGGGNMGQLGNGNYSDILLPTRIENLEIRSIQEIESGDFHNCALVNEGKIFCWGWNAYGQVGDGTFDNSNIPVQVSMPEDLEAKKISIGGSNSCALLENDDIYCWGNNKNKQIDTSENFRINIPVKLSLSEGEDINDIFVGSSHICSFLATNNYDCLGKIVIEDSNNSKIISEIVAGNEYNCFIYEDGKINCDGVMDFDKKEIVPLELISARVPKLIFPGTLTGHVNSLESSIESIIIENDNLKSEIIITTGEIGFIDNDDDGWLDDLELLCESDPMNHESIPLDSDDDKICNPIDNDDDGDGIIDNDDYFPLNSHEWIDSDKDGIGKNSELIEVGTIAFVAIITNFILISLLIFEIIKLSTYRRQE